MAIQTDIEGTVILTRDSCNPCLGKQRRAEIIRQRPHKRFAAFSKGLQGGTLARAFLDLGEARHAANDAAFRLFSFVELRESATNAEPLRITCVEAGNERPHKAIEQLRGEFSADEGGDGFVSIGGNAFPEDVANEGPFRRAIDERTHEKRGGTHGHGPEFAVDQDISRCAWRGLQQFLRNAELRAKLAKRRRNAETLRSQFQQEAVASYRADDTTGTRRGLDQLCVDPGFAQSVGADEAGDATADHQCWDMTGHGDVSTLVGSECFRKERL